MEPVRVAFPPEWDESIKTRVAERGKKTVVDYLRDLVAQDIERPELDDETERLLLEGLDSGLGEPADERFWEERRRKLDEYIQVKRL